MKRLLPHIFVAFLAVSQIPALAQPTLTAAGNNIQIGDQFPVHQITVAAADFTTAAPAGANQTWNFSSLASAGALQAEVLARSSAPNPTMVPAANMVIKLGDEYGYVENTGTVLREYGAVETMQNFSLENTDPAEKLRFPITFNTTFTDAFAGTANLNGTMIPRNGNVTVNAEGYGTLITPAGTFQNVLKIKTEESANPMTIYSEQTTTYDWFQPGTKFPLLRMTRRVTLLATVLSGFYLANTLGAPEDLAAQLGLQVSPNPASGAATIEFSLTSPAEVAVSVFNLVGQEVQKLRPEKADAGVQIRKIDVAGLPKGIYQIRLTAGQNVAVKRLVVQ